MRNQTYAPTEAGNHHFAPHPLESTDSQTVLEPPAFQLMASAEQPEGDGTIQRYIEPRLQDETLEAMQHQQHDRILRRFAENSFRTCHQLADALEADDLQLEAPWKLDRAAPAYDHLADTPTQLDPNNQEEWVNTIGDESTVYATGAINDPCDALLQAHEAVQQWDEYDGATATMLQSRAVSHTLRDAEVTGGVLGVPVLLRDPMLSILDAGKNWNRRDEESFARVPEHAPGCCDFQHDHYDYEFRAEGDWKGANQKAETVEELLSGISGSDIVQEGLGLCYLYAPLASLATLNPALIRSMFVALTDTTATIRLFTARGIPVYVRVDRTRVDGYYGNSRYFLDGRENAEWAHLIVKAYILAGFGARETEGKSDAEVPGYLEKYGLKSSNEGGGEHAPIVHLTGHRNAHRRTFMHTVVTDSDLDAIRQALDEGKVVTCGFESLYKAFGFLNHDSVFRQHTYTLLGYEGDNFLIRNPWGKHVPTQVEDGDGFVADMHYDPCVTADKVEGNEGAEDDVQDPLIRSGQDGATNGWFVLSSMQMKSNASGVTINEF